MKSKNNGHFGAAHQIFLGKTSLKQSCLFGQIKAMYSEYNIFQYVEYRKNRMLDRLSVFKLTVSAALNISGTRQCMCLYMQECFSNT